MSDYLLSDDAAEDLQHIYINGLDRFGEAQADQYLDEFYHLFDLFSDNPEMGVDIDVQGNKLQLHSHKSHIVIFEPIYDGVKILRIFHGGADYFRQL